MSGSVITGWGNAAGVPHPADRPARDGLDTGVEACLYWYVVLTPLWWMTGLLAPLGAVGVLAVMLRRLPSCSSALTVGLLWLGVAAAQLAATLAGWFAADSPPMGLVRAVASLTITGWVLMAACLLVGGAMLSGSARLVRALCVLGGWILILTLVSLIMAWGFGITRFSIPSPLSLVLPESNFVIHQMTMRFYLTDELMGGRSFRLILFYPWPTALGVAGAGLLLVAGQEKDAVWRWIGRLGGGTAVLFSYSRAVAVSLILAGGLILFLRLSLLHRLALVMLGAGVLNLALLFGYGPVDLVHLALDYFHSLRSGSSESRNLLYDITWQHALRAPLLGHGWFSAALATWMPVPLGSHSTIYGALYLGGVVTLAAVILAYAATLVAAALRLKDRPGAHGVLGYLIVLGMVSYGENINTLVPTLIPLFIWVGSVLPMPGPRHAA